MTAQFRVKIPTLNFLLYDDHLCIEAGRVARELAGDSRITQWDLLTEDATEYIGRDVPAEAVAIFAAMAYGHPLEPILANIYDKQSRGEL